MELSAALAFVSFSEERMLSFQQLLRGLERKTAENPRAPDGGGTQACGEPALEPGVLPQPGQGVPTEHSQ